MKRRARQVNELSVKRQNTNFDGDVETSTTPCTTNSEVSDKLNPHLLLHSLSAEEISTAPDITVDGIDFEEEDIDPSEIGFSGGALLDKFIYPMTRTEFLSTIWRKKAYAITNSPLARVQAMVTRFMFDLDLDTMLGETASSNIFVWMPSVDEVGGGTEASTKLNSMQLDESQVEAAKICYQGGGSLYFRSSQEMADVFVRAMANGVGLHFAGLFADGTNKGEIETFVSRKGNKTDWHTDFQENFTFQLTGKKKWLLRKSKLAHPIRGATPQFTNIDTAEQQTKVHRLSHPAFGLSTSVPSTRPSSSSSTPSAPSSSPSPSSSSFSSTDTNANRTDDNELGINSTAASCAGDTDTDAMDYDKYDYEEVILGPGDLLYHPAGVWHRVECIEDSISINISLVGTTWADLACDGIKQMLWRDDKWRQMICLDNVEQGRKHMQVLLSNLNQHISQLQPSDFLPPTIFATSSNNTYPPADDSSDNINTNNAVSSDADAGVDTNAHAHAHAHAHANANANANANTHPSTNTDSSRQRTLAPSTVFRANPLASLMRSDDLKTKAECEAERLATAEANANPFGSDRSIASARNDNGDGDVKNIQHEHAMETEEKDVVDIVELASAHDPHHSNDSGVDSEDLSDGESNGPLEDAQDCPYVLNINYGNDSLDSLVREVLHIDTALSPVVDAFIYLAQNENQAQHSTSTWTVPHFSAQDVLRVANTRTTITTNIDTGDTYTGLAMADVSSVANLLVQQGYITVAQEQM